MTDRVAAVSGLAEVEELIDEFIVEKINPGMTTDIVCAAMFVVLERRVPLRVTTR